MTLSLLPRPFIAIALVFSLAIHNALSALAASDANVLLQELTWTELRDSLAKGYTTAIIPIGGTEQSGPAIALGKHNVRVAVLSQEIAAKLGNTLVAPVIAYVPEGSLDPPTEHMKFPGTITVPKDVFTKTIEYAARSLRNSGFHDIVLLGDHGGYQREEEAVAGKLNAEWKGTGTRVYAIREYYRAATTDFAALLASKGFSREEIGTHAGVADTSLMLAVAPSLVRLEQLRSGPKLEGRDGVYGDPRRSSAELGKLGTELIVTRTVSIIRQAIAKR